MIEKVKLLKEKIEKKEAIEKYLKAEKERVLNQYEENNKLSIEAVKEFEEEITKLKLELSESAIGNYKNTKEKNYIAGIKVQEVKKLVYDEKTAFEYALDKKMFLSFDKKSFEKVAIDLKIDFVTQEINLRATFPSEIKI